MENYLKIFFEKTHSESEEPKEYRLVHTKLRIRGTIDEEYPMEGEGVFEWNRATIAFACLLLNVRLKRDRIEGSSGTPASSLGSVIHKQQGLRKSRREKTRVHWLRRIFGDEALEDYICATRGKGNYYKVIWNSNTILSEHIKIFQRVHQDKRKHTLNEKDSEHIEFIGAKEFIEITDRKKIEKIIENLEGIVWENSVTFPKHIELAEKYTDVLEKRYNNMRILGMSKPIPLQNIYVRVNLLEKITSIKRIPLEKLEKQFEIYKKGFGKIQETQPGLDIINKYDKVIVLGKPGAGKTTFLKSLIFKALYGKLKRKRIPVFVNIKNWSEEKKNLFSFIIEEFNIYGFSHNHSLSLVKHLLESGDCLILLDGLDEVSSVNIYQIIKEIKTFSEKYDKNQFIISCRIASYNYVFEKFIDIEIADFNDDQIEIFIKKWFGEEKRISEMCWQKLNEIKNESIKEISSSPLILTMLCIVFEEILDFPDNRAELYNEAIHALLRKWDSSRQIKRDSIYRELSLERKQHMLCKIAYDTFKSSNYFIPVRRKISAIATDKLIFFFNDIFRMIRTDTPYCLSASRALAISYITNYPHFLGWPIALSLALDLDKRVDRSFEHSFSLALDYSFATEYLDNFFNTVDRDLTNYLKGSKLLMDCLLGAMATESRWISGIPLPSRCYGHRSIKAS